MERPHQDWDNHLADYVVVELTAKGVKPPTPKPSGCLTMLAIVLLIVAAIAIGVATWS